MLGMLAIGREAYACQFRGTCRARVDLEKIEKKHPFGVRIGHGQAENGCIGIIPCKAQATCNPMLTFAALLAVCGEETLRSRLPLSR